VVIKVVSVDRESVESQPFLYMEFFSVKEKFKVNSLVIEFFSTRKV
jgi:hypothetical protein